MTRVTMDLENAGDVRAGSIEGFAKLFDEAVKGGMNMDDCHIVYVITGRAEKADPDGKHKNLAEVAANCDDDLHVLRTLIIATNTVVQSMEDATEAAMENIQTILAGKAAQGIPASHKH